MGKIYKALMFDNEISVCLLDTTDVVNTAIDYHKLSPLAAATLGRTLTVTLFMASGLKNENDSVTVTISGDGPCGHVVTVADSALTCRGYVDNPEIDLPLKPNGKLDVASYVGKGRITVVKNMGLKEPYTGSARIVSGEIAEDFASYYTYSEQQPTGIALGVKIGTDYSCIGAGGLILQPMPGASDENITKAEELLDKFSNISTLVETMGIEGIIKEYFSDVEFDVRETSYKCSCSKERIDRVLVTIGKEELMDTVQKEGKVEVTCHFCPKVYTYNKEDIDTLFK